mmetsp:Transcript_12874/g.29205  ORF Transcript_12874/g.29205 Transcript_12874/m.29205 type:complete len:254 (+) Transcript_12874:1296-2057(+)
MEPIAAVRALRQAFGGRSPHEAHPGADLSDLVQDCRGGVRLARLVRTARQLVPHASDLLQQRGEAHVIERGMARLGLPWNRLGCVDCAIGQVLPQAADLLEHLCKACIGLGAAVPDRLEHRREVHLAPRSLDLFEQRGHVHLCPPLADVLDDPGDVHLGPLLPDGIEDRGKVHLLPQLCHLLLEGPQPRVQPVVPVVDSDEGHGPVALPGRGRPGVQAPLEAANLLDNAIQVRTSATCLGQLLAMSKALAQGG